MASFNWAFAPDHGSLYSSTGTFIQKVDESPMIAENRSPAAILQPIVTESPVILSEAKMEQVQVTEEAKLIVAAPKEF